MQFTIHRGHECLVSEEIDISASRSFFLNEALEETDSLSFTLEDYPEQVDFRLRIGDKPLPHASYYRRRIEWERAQYLSSCLGKVPVVLETRQKDATLWKKVFLTDLICYPGKITRQQYKKMLQDISLVSRGLMLDIVSSTHSLFGWAVAKSAEELSGVEEYFMINQFLERFEPILERINSDPGSQLTVIHIQSLCYGQENFSQRSLAQINRSGTDPRKAGSIRPFRCEIQKKKISFDIWENRQIAALCNWIADRASSVANKAQIQIDTIKRDKQWRQIAPKGKISLWDIEDAPRIAHLEASVESCRKIQRRVSFYPKRFGFLDGVGGSKLDLKPTPKFTKDLFYSHAYVAMVEFIGNNGILFDSGKFEQKLKETSKLYEYWVYLILFFYLKERFALSMATEAPFLNLAASKDRYVLDINSGDHIEFLSGNGFRIVMHYEPKFMSRNEAENAGNRFLRSSLRGKRPLVPDVLIEILSGPAESPRLEYGIVMDCKYTKRIQEIHWNEVEKYQSQLFERTGFQNVANQLWIIHPGERPYWQINIPVDSIEDTVRMPRCGIQGVLSLAPAMNEKKPGSLDHYFTQLDDSIGKIIQMFVEKK